MKWKKLAEVLLFPHVAVMLILIPVSVSFLVGAMLYFATDSLPAILSYVLSAYTLTVWCLQLPRLVRRLRVFRAENKYAKRWQEDTRLRVNLSLFGSLIWNTAYGIFQLWLGFYHHTFWFYSLAAYYISLAVMRFFLVRHTRVNRPGVRMREELLRYRACGWIFLLMNLALTLMIFFMVYWNRTFTHHEITTIAMAAYTFTSFSFAIVNMVRYRRLGSPVYSAAKAISFASACVSMLTLTSTMLTTFGDETMDLSARRLMLAATGAAVSAVILAMAVYMIVKGNQRLKRFADEK